MKLHQLFFKRNNTNSIDFVAQDPIKTEAFAFLYQYETPMTPSELRKQIAQGKTKARELKK